MLQSIAPVVRDAELGLKYVELCTTEVSDCAIHVTSGHMSVAWIGETNASCKQVLNGGNRALVSLISTYWVHVLRRMH